MLRQRFKCRHITGNVEGQVDIIRAHRRPAKGDTIGGRRDLVGGPPVQHNGVIIGGAVARDRRNGKLIRVGTTQREVAGRQNRINVGNGQADRLLRDTASCWLCDLCGVGAASSTTGFGNGGKVISTRHTHRQRLRTAVLRTIIGGDVVGVSTVLAIF